MSSTRSVHVPPSFLASRWLYSTVLSPPRCRNPVGDGANRSRTGEPPPSPSARLGVGTAPPAEGWAWDEQCRHPPSPRRCLAAARASSVRVGVCWKRILARNEGNQGLGQSGPGDPTRDRGAARLWTDSVARRRAAQTANPADAPLASSPACEREVACERLYCICSVRESNQTEEKGEREGDRRMRPMCSVKTEPSPYPYV